MKQELSPIEKAKSLKDKMELEELQNQQNQKAQKRAELKEFLDEQMKVHQEEMEGVNSLKEDVKKSDTFIKEGKEKRTSKKTEAKEAANILRDEKGKLNIKSNEEMREIFAPIIKTLQDINEQVKIENELKKTTSKELEEKQKTELKRAWEVVRKFKEEHPELIEIEGKKKTIEDTLARRERLFKKLDALETQFAPYLNHKLRYEDHRRNLIDITARKRMEELNKITETEQRLAEEKIKNLREEVGAYISKGKGFFQSNKSFNDKCKELRKNQAEQEKTFWVEYRKAWDEKTPLQKHIYELDRNYNFRDAFDEGYSDEFKNYINQEGGVTFAQLFAEAKKRNQKYIETLVLDENEMLIKEIADTLEKNETTARRSSRVS
jgi:hypothetical protein